MKIYTKGGDAGQTSLFGGARVSKDHLRIQAYGTLDELNACLGVALVEHAGGVKTDSIMFERLTRLQQELFQLGAELATPADKKISMQLLGMDAIERLEKEIDAMEAKLQPLTQFILPRGTHLSANLHLARTISRRAEREIVTLNAHENVRTEVLQYINRVSDYLFVSARFANRLAGIADAPWTAPKN